MLHLHFANRFETLTQRLLAQLDASAGADPFATESVIVPSAAVRRALTLAIARHRGICANVGFDYLAQWLWRQIARLVPGIAETSPFAPSVLAWRVREAFVDAGFTAASPRLAGWLANADAVMVHELAERVAQQFDATLTYRPDWLAAWAAGGQPPELLRADLPPRARDDAQWQAALWRRLLAELRLDPLHPAEQVRALLRHGGAAAAAAAGLPERVHLVALPAMPPLYMELLRALGEVAEVHLHQLNPCREYWFEIVGPRRLAHLRARGADALHETGNRLLAAWGGQTQSHLGLLVERLGDAIDDEGDYVSPVEEAAAAGRAPTLLEHVQSAMLDLRELAPASIALAPDDRSIELHVAHSPTRELEVLHDRLLGLFAADPTLAPSDVLVVTPDLDALAPRVDAVFGTVPRERFIPYRITGRGESGQNPLAKALLALLDLAGSRCTAPALLALLREPPVARRFALDEAALERLHAWMDESGMRWGLDAAHRATLGLPAQARHTLRDGVERLLLGHVLADDAGDQADGLFAGQLPAGGAAGGEALALGALAAAVDGIGALQAATAEPLPPAQWPARLLAALEQFIAAAPQELEALQSVQQAIAALADDWRAGGATSPLPLALVRRALAARLDEPARGGVPTGAVTVSAIASLRGLPFRVVCAIGLDDAAFPATVRPAEFDLIALAPRPGDRQRRLDERNLFLDLLLAAREVLHLSHTGRSLRDNSPLPPSVLVAELLDVVVPAIAAAPGDAAALATARRRLVVEHPMQSFAAQAFRVDGADPRLRSFDAEIAEALRHAATGTSTAAADADTRRSVPAAAASAPVGATVGPTPEREEHANAALRRSGPDDDGDDDAEMADPDATRFFPRPLPAPGAEWREVPLDALVRFFRHPAKALLRERLGLALHDPDEPLADVEPLLPDYRARRALGDRLLPRLIAHPGPLDDAAIDALVALAEAGGELPAGALGERLVREELRTLAAFAARVRQAFATSPLPPHRVELAFDLEGEPWRLHAAFADLRPGGLLRHRADDELRVGDLLAAWIAHLALNASPPAGVEPCTTLLSLREVGRFRPCDSRDEAHRTLATLLQAYRRGLSEPLAFFPKSAFAAMSAAPERRLSTARAKWSGSDHAEGTDPWWRLAWRGVPDPIAETDFAELGPTLLGPMLAHLAREPLRSADEVLQ